MNIEEIIAEMKTITLVDIIKYLEQHERLKSKELAVKIGIDMPVYYDIKANRRKMLTREQWDNIMFEYMIYRFNDSGEVLENDIYEQQLLHPKINWVKRINKLMKQLKKIDSEEIKEFLSMLEICEENNQYVVSYKGITYNPIAKSGNVKIIFLSNILLDFLSQIIILLEKEKNNEMKKEKFGENFKNVMKAFSLAMELKSDIITY